jgi:hypothetical protein
MAATNLLMAGTLLAADPAGIVRGVTEGDVTSMARLPELLAPA